MTLSAPPTSALAREWQEAARILGLEIVAPFVLNVRSDRILADVLVKQFGAPNGMLLVTDFDQVRLQQEAIEQAGFGFSVLSEPDERHALDIDSLIRVLRDWGWAGSETDRPAWLGPQEANE